MSAIILILIILICLVLSFFVLIQNPKGGGMAGTFGGFGNSVMGAKQSSDAIEKGTWYSMAALALVVLLSFVLMPKTKNTIQGNEIGEPLKASSMPAQQAPPPTSPAPQAASPLDDENVAGQDKPPADANTEGALTPTKDAEKPTE